MPRKRKAGKTKGKPQRKKAKKEDKPRTVKEAIQVLKKADKGKANLHRQVDAFVPVGKHHQVHEDYDCMLTLTDIGNNINRFCVMQVVTWSCTSYFTWTRSGRVGQPGSNSFKGPMELTTAVKKFEKNFEAKTNNKWEKRNKFSSVPGKYTLLKMANEVEDDEVKDKADDPPVLETSGKKKTASKLDSETQELIKLIFEFDEFKIAMNKPEIDMKKIPLGKLSKTQIAKGLEVLEEIEQELKKSKQSHAKLQDLSSKLYTLIPRDFGAEFPPTVSDAGLLQQETEMLLVLGDIELAGSPQKAKDKPMKTAVANKGGTAPNPLDACYDLLKCDLQLLDLESEEFDVISKYKEATEATYPEVTIQNIWKVNRDGEAERFNIHEKITNRKLLWHGTNVANVASILKNGLRIMPEDHGGMMGRGIHFASDSGDAVDAVCVPLMAGILFLCEVALGKEYQVRAYDSSLIRAPAGYDSVVGKGRMEPDSKYDTSLKLDGKKVTFPLGKPVEQSKYKKSRFGLSDYRIYNESQCRIRYLVRCEFTM